MRSCSIAKISYVLLNYEGGYVKILAATIFVLIFSHWFDLYDPTRCSEKGEVYLRLLLVPGVLAVLGSGCRRISVSPSDCWATNPFVFGLIILTAALFGWRERRTPS